MAQVHQSKPAWGGVLVQEPANCWDIAWCTWCWYSNETEFSLINESNSDSKFSLQQQKFKLGGVLQGIYAQWCRQPKSDICET